MRKTEPGAGVCRHSTVKELMSTRARAREKSAERTAERLQRFSSPQEAVAEPEKNALRPPRNRTTSLEGVAKTMNALLEDDALCEEVIRRLSFTHRDIMLTTLRDTRRRSRAMRRGDYGKRYISGETGG